MTLSFRQLTCRLLVFVGVQVLACSVVYAEKIAQSQQFDPLALESAPVEKIEEERDIKIFLEGTLGNVGRRYSLGDSEFRRASVDIFFSRRPGAGPRFVFSNRIDSINPAAQGDDDTVNSLREAYLSWQFGNSDVSIDLGRINARSGPAYGYNPTDFFRDHSLRVITSADPIALRQNRMGSFMLRGQRLWANGSLTAAFSPKLASSPSADGWSLDFGATNSRHRGLVSLGTKLSESVNSQVHLYKEDGMPATLGLSVTALLTDALTSHFEFTRGREPDLQSRVFSSQPRMVTRNRFVAGATFTSQSKTSVTAEYEYNGFALDKAGWMTLSTSPGAQLTYLGSALRLQELAHREAMLIYVTQKDLWIKNLDLSAYLRYNTTDSSRLAWLELRHHWPQFDLTFQWQRNLGRSNSEFGIVPDKRLMQVLGTFYF